MDRPIPGIGGMAFVHEYDPTRELVTLPKGTSIYPSYYDELWQIAQEVAEKDVTHVDEDDKGEMVCPFCDTITSDFIHEFPHTDSCIVVKARKLMEQRKVVVI